MPYVKGHSEKLKTTLRKHDTLIVDSQYSNLDKTKRSGQVEIAKKLKTILNVFKDFLQVNFVIKMITLILLSSWRSANYFKK